MSKIQFNELNTSEFNTLDTEETANVVGGSFYYYPSLSFFSETNISEKTAVVNQGNTNFNSQAAIGGGFAFNSNGNSNGTSQGNNAFVSQ